MNSLALHLGIVIFFIVSWRGMLQLSDEVVKILKEPTGLEFRYLTNWNFALQSTIFLGYLLYDVLELCGLFSGQRQRLKKILDFYFYSISAPSSFCVAILFWIMYIFDHKLIFPVLLDQLIPLWLNHAIHTVIVINAVLQTYHNKFSPPKLTKYLRSFTIFYVVYLICIYETYFEKQQWIYPFIEKVDEPYRFIMLVLIFISCVLISLIFHYCNAWYCSSQAKLESQRAAGRKKQKS